MVGVPHPTPGDPQKEARPRAQLMTALVSLAFLVLAGRLYQLQILRGDEYKERADENFVKELRVPADRGFILDRNRRILVDSRPSYDVTLTPYFCGKQCDDILDTLAKLLSLSDEELERAGLGQDFVRLSVGIEDLDDILADLEQALEQV